MPRRPQYHGSSSSRASPVDIKDDEDNEHDRYVKSFINGATVRSLRTFPSELVDCDEKIRALFRVWMRENKRSYQSPAEQERRYGGFKDRLIRVNFKNSMPNSGMKFGLNLFADLMPSDPWIGAQMTEEEGLKLRLARKGSRKCC